jgi:hypothetical protein
LTYLDIYKYIKGKFEQSEAFQRLSKKDIASESLVQEIIEKAA